VAVEFIYFSYELKVLPTQEVVLIKTIAQWWGEKNL
jgi:hypothetical protein